MQCSLWGAITAPHKKRSREFGNMFLLHRLSPNFVEP